MAPEEKVEGLQAARAVAALAVAYFHSYVAVRGFSEAAQHPMPFLKEWGFLGVNFFFAISGYVICLVCSRPSFSVRSFVIKRVFRLYPMYFVVMLAVALLMLMGDYRQVSLSNFLWSLTLIPQQIPPAFDLSWSMEREIVFYAIAVIAVPIAGLWGLAAALAALTYYSYFTGWGATWTFQVVSSTQADFLAGVLIFLFRDYLRWLGFFVPLVCGSAALYFSMSDSIPFGPPVAMSILLVAMMNLKLDWKRAPARWLVQAGDASYSIYLLHYLVFLGMGKLAEVLHFPAWTCEPWRYLCLLLTCMISIETYKWIESHAIHFGNQIVARFTFSPAPQTS